MIENVEAAITSCHGVSIGKRVRNMTSPKGSVLFETELMMIKGHRKSFQVERKVNST